MSIYLFVSPLAPLAFSCVPWATPGENRVGEVQARGGAGVGGTMAQSFSLAPEHLCLVCLSGSHFYSCALLLFPLHREVHSETYFTLIYVQK